MNSKYKVINSTKTIVEGMVDVDGEMVEFKRGAHVVEMSPASDYDNSGTIKLVATGQAIYDAEKFKVGDVITVTFSKDE